MRPATLTGLAVGDALGLPFETHHFMSAELAKWDGSYLASRGLNNLQPNRAAGEWSDDTMMARALAASIIECNTYSPVAAAAAYVEWYVSGDHRGMGANTRAALERLLSGHHWVNSGLVHSEGNGSAMRAAPLGLYYRNSLITAADMARTDAQITHRSVEAIEGSAAMALGVAMLANQVAAPITLTKAVTELLHDSKLRTRLQADVVWREQVLRSAKDTMLFLLEAGTGAHVGESVPAAFMCFAACTNYKDTVELAIRLGGDTDTIAAMAGALAGTFYGHDQVEPYLGELEEAHMLNHLNDLLYLGAPKFSEEP
jgi:ADP-ribosylglycohydrolase